MKNPLKKSWLYFWLIIYYIGLYISAFAILCTGGAKEAGIFLKLNEE